MITTDRLSLRELTEADVPELKAILQDPLAMVAYEGAFSDAEVAEWLERMQERYRKDGFALWAAVLRDTGQMIGQCGLTIQDIDGLEVIEVGYLFNRAHWHKGYAVEGATACRDYAFTALGAHEVYAQVRDINTASMNVAIRLGMTVQRRFIKHYRGIDMPHLAFSIPRSRWEDLTR